ncbi:MAG: hypothetical protein GY751_19560, partial [Bacteroidetes bacterium]|nr:hypothetical protein [Bacteroidota bacterium]
FGKTVAIDDDNNTIQYLPVSGSVMTNDFDLEGEIQPFGGYFLYGGNLHSTITSGAILSGSDLEGNPIANAGSITFDARGDYTFTPNGDFTGEVLLSYYICDASGNCADAYLKIIVSPYSIPTIEFNSVVSNNDDHVSFGNTIHGNIFGNDMDPDLDNISLSNIEITNTVTGEVSNHNSLNNMTLISGWDEYGISVNHAGVIGIKENGEFTFNPMNAFVGHVSLNYEICDDQEGQLQSCYNANLTIKVLEPQAAGGNNRPFAGDDFACTVWNKPITGNWMNSDYDNDEDLFNLVGVEVNSIIGRREATFSYPTRKGGTISFFDDGTYDYDPLLDYYGPDQYRYLICDVDTLSKCDSATIYFIVNPIRKDFGDHPAEYATASHYISLDED